MAESPERENNRQGQQQVAEFMKGTGQTMKKTISAIGVLLGLLGFVSAGQAVVDRVVAVVNQEIITLSEVESRSSLLKEEREGKDRLAIRQRTYEFHRKALDQIIDEKLIDQEIKRAGIKVTGKEVEAAVEEIRRRNNLTQEEFENALVKEGLNPDSFRKQVEKRLQRVRLIQRSVRVDYSAGEKELREFYQKNIERYRTKESYRASHILLHVRKEAAPAEVRETQKKCQAVLERIKGGADFAEMAVLYSDDASAKGGGDIGFFTKGELLPSFEHEALRLQVGETSGVVRTQFGFHIIKLTERRSGVPPFEEIRKKVETDYYEKESETAFTKYLSTLKEKAIIEIKL
jgi:peptidyl-prolyl cis-trans isomerase SurA